VIRARNASTALATFAAFAAAAIAISAPAAAGAASRRAHAVARCKSLGSGIVATDRVRVYRRGGRTDYTTYACDLRTGRTTRLGGFTQGSGFGTYAFAIAGAFVGFDDLDCERDFCQDQVRVVDVRSGRERATPLVETDEFVDGLVVTTTGAVAWMRPAGGIREVREFDGGGVALLDSGPGIDATSHALGGSTHYWIDSGTAKTATLR
jgi:hypothetical protein